MNIARLLYPIQVLGPGRRIGIWVCGCRRACKGCSNPELWVPRPEYEVSIPEILQLVRRVAADQPVDGFTISGGEPMDQAGELAILLEELALISEDILVYTGYRLCELRKMRDPAVNAVLEHTAVLIDGAYIEARNDDSLLRGSSNQEIHILDPALAGNYEAYLNSAHNQIQNFTTSDGVVSVGIHRRSFTGGER
ncbi:MAG: 4Fe-4S cluster-binding domain-containing protein [Mogibacterium sp.]|nr:4Fe-4S cluster-binding domain-containing protein [Mogibacterium sp.]